MSHYAAKKLEDLELLPAPTEGPAILIYDIEMSC